MFTTFQDIVLASASPRRQAYLRDLGIEFEVAAPHINEDIFADESPYTYVERVARAKAEAVMSRYPSRWIIAADTAVIYKDEVLGKPIDIEDAVHTLMLLSGNVHEVVTSFFLGKKRFHTFHQESVLTKVTFSSFSYAHARVYAGTGEWRDKAGAYGIQGKGACLVAAVDGSYSNVVGLPLCEVIGVMQKYGIIGI